MDYSEGPRVLSLFSGIGGLDLGVARALGGVRAVGYVEREAYCVSILARRIEEGALAPGPIFAGDVREFPAAEFRGRVDLLIGGFPCPPFSTAGRRRAASDPRNLWPEVVRVLRETETGWLFCENVAGILTVASGRFFGDMLADLDHLGYDVAWGSVRASDVGAPHRRERVFILGRRRDVAVALGGGGRSEIGDSAIGGWGTAGGGPTDILGLPVGPSVQHPADARVAGEGLADARNVESGGRDNGSRARREDGVRPEGQTEGSSGELAESNGDRLDRAALRPSGLPGPRSSQAPGAELGGDRNKALVLWPPGPEERDRWARVIERWPELAPATVEPGVLRVADGVPRRMDRLRALGNAVVPAQAEAAFRELYRRMREET